LPEGSIGASSGFIILLQGTPFVSDHGAEHDGSVGPTKVRTLIFQRYVTDFDDWRQSLTSPAFSDVSNAAEVVPKGGILTVRTANCYLDKPFSGYNREKREIMLFSASPILLKACLPPI
jgi:hypothetical protein